jgi:hypothetical protein
MEGLLGENETPKALPTAPEKHAESASTGPKEGLKIKLALRRRTCSPAKAPTVGCSAFERRLRRRNGFWGGSEGAVEAPFDDSALLDVLHRLVVQAEVVADLMDYDVPHQLGHLLGIVAVFLDRTLIDVNRIRQHIAV